MKTPKLKAYKPTRLEVVKTVIIAVMITGAIAFYAGTVYADSVNNRVDNAVQAVEQSTKK